MKCKKKYKNETKSSENNLSNTVPFKHKKLNSTSKLFKHKDYLYGNKVYAKKEENQTNSLHNRETQIEECIGLKLGQEQDKNKSSHKEPRQTVSINSNERPNNSLKSRKCKTKSVSCKLCSNSFSSKKSLANHEMKIHVNEMSNESGQKNQDESEGKVHKCLKEKHDIDEALNNLEILSTTGRLLQNNVEINKTQLNKKKVKVVKSSKIRRKIKNLNVPQKGYAKKKNNQVHLDNEIQANSDQNVEKSVCYVDEREGENCTNFSNFYKETITHEAMLHQVDVTGEDNSVQSVKQCTTRSVTRRQSFAESHMSETVRNESQILNNSNGSVSELMFNHCNSAEELNGIGNETIAQHDLQLMKNFHEKSNNPSAYNLCNRDFFSDQVLREDKNEDRLTLDAVPHLNYPQEQSLELKQNGSILQGNLSKIQNNCISQQFDNGDKYQINKSITIGKSSKTICGKMGEVMESECHIQMSKQGQQKTCSIVEGTRIKKLGRPRKIKRARFGKLQSKNNNEESKSLVKVLKNNKQLIVPLVRVENLPSSELSKLIQNTNDVEIKVRDEQEKVYHQTSNIVEVQCLVSKKYRNTNIKTNKICMKNSVIRTCQSQKKSSSSYLDQEIDAHMKTIGVVSIHRYNEKELEAQIEEKRTENILSPQIRNEVSEESSNNEINKTETYGKSISELQLENIANFFIYHKRKMINNTVNRKGNISSTNKNEIHGIRKTVALCFQCEKVFDLLQQFSDKINFMQDERLRMECTLCGLQIYTLSHFQEHVMGVHLPCEKTCGRKAKFPVNILHFNEHLHLNNNKSKTELISECWCCSKVFKGSRGFQLHLKRMHNISYDIKTNDVKKPKEKKVTQDPEVYRTFDVANNTTDIFNQSEKSVIETSSRVDEYYFNTKEINLKNSICYTDSNEVKHSSITHITQKISNISLTSESEFVNVANVEDSRKDKNGSFLYVCNVCPKTYKRKRNFLLHMSMHSKNSNNITNKQQEISEENSIIQFETNAFISNVHAENVQSHSNNCENNNAIESPPTHKYLEESKCSLIRDLTSDENSIGTTNVRNESSKNVAEIENVVLGTDNAFDCNYLLNINFKEKSTKSVKRQKSIKFNINVTKKRKTNDTGQEIVSSEIIDKLPLKCRMNTDFILQKTKRQIRCNVCDKIFISQKVLKEHMFFLHNSISESAELSNLLTPYFDDLFNFDSISTQSIDKFRKECNVLTIKNTPAMVIQRDKIHEKPIVKINNKNAMIERSRKWRCDVCKENFALLRNYLRHKYYYHNDESVVHICDNCNKVLTSVAMVNIHICTSVNSWNCKRCNLTFVNGISLTQHNISNHFEATGTYECSLCKLKFLTMHMLQRHTVKHSEIATSSNVTNSVDLSVKNVPHSLNCTNNSGIELPELEIELANDKDITCINKSTKDVNETSEAVKNPLEANDKDITCINKSTKDVNETSEAVKNPLEANTVSNVISLPCDDDELFKCKLCNMICLTKIQMKVHLEKWHNIKVEMCQLCNDLYSVDEITKHLINRHIILDDSDFKEDNINVQTCEEMKDLEKDIVRVLGFKRLLSLYEYQRFDNIPENKGFNCVTCVKEFPTIQSYKIHYLKYHDIVCLLCNIKFKHSYQAFVHKIKIHTSVDLYLWVIQKVAATVLQFNKHGTTMEDIMLHYSENRLYDEEKRFTNAKEHNSIEGFEMKFHEYFWLRNYYQFEKLDVNKELLYTVEKFKNSDELSENVNNSILIIDHSNYKHSSVLNNCELSPQSINKVLS